MNKISIPPLSEYYNFDRLEDAARELHLNTEEQENEEKLFNLHNHLIWHSYRPFEDALTDAIFSVVIQKIIEDYNLLRRMHRLTTGICWSERKEV